MMKGQAFDTFKLLIAAVVAVAILGILLGILGGIFWPGANPYQVAKDQLTSASNYKGLPQISTSTAAFKKGMTMDGGADTFKNAIGGVGSIQFHCSTDVASACQYGTSTADPNSNTAIILRDFSALISACCSSGNACNVYIGNQTAPC